MTTEQRVYGLLYLIAIACYIAAVALLIYERVRIIHQSAVEHRRTGRRIQHNFGILAVDGWLAGMTVCLVIVGYVLARLLGWHGDLAHNTVYPILLAVILLPLVSALRVVHWEWRDRSQIGAPEPPRRGDIC